MPTARWHPSFVLEFKQATFRNLGPVESDNLAELAQRWPIASRSITLPICDRTGGSLPTAAVRFIKSRPRLLLDPKQSSALHIHPSDLSDLLAASASI